MTDKPRAYSQMFLGIDRAKPGSDKTVYWRKDDGEDRQTATQVRERAARARQDDPGDTWRQISAGSIAAFGALTWDKDPDTAPLPREGPRLGEIIGWRAWWVVVLPSCFDSPYLKSLARNVVWEPDEPMSGEPSDHGRDGVNAFKTRNWLIYVGLPAMPFTRDPFVIGQVALWGDVIEHEHGYRAQFGAVHSLDAVIGMDGEMHRFGDKLRGKNWLLRDLRRRYNVEGG